MKICILTSIFPRFKGDHCGAGTTIYEMTKKLSSQHELDMSVVAPNYYRIPKYEVVDGVKIYRFSYFFPRKLQKLAYDAGIPTNLRKFKLAKVQLPLFILNFIFRAFWRVKNADIVHIQWILNGIAGVPLGKIFQKPRLINVHRVVSTGRWMRLIIKYIVENVDFLIFNSSYTRDELLKVAQPKQYCVLPCTIDIDKFTPGKRGNLRHQLGFSDDTLVIFFVGYLIEKKGIRYLLEAMPNILAKLRNVQLVLAGGGTDLEKLKQQAKDLNIEKHVTFLGWVKNDDLADYYRDADVFVLPSIIDSKGETETQGLVLAEAMACGTPVVGSNVGGIPDVITPEVGFLAEPKNSIDLADKIVMMLSDPETRKKMSQSAIRWAREHFSWHSVSRKYIEIYNEIVIGK